MGCYRILIAVQFAWAIILISGVYTVSSRHASLHGQEGRFRRRGHGAVPSPAPPDDLAIVDEKPCRRLRCPGAAATERYRLHLLLRHTVLQELGFPQLLYHQVDHKVSLTGTD
jgi:hypothetical protein